MANPPPPREHYHKPINRFYRLGNPRGNENPFLLTFGVLWFRYHNFIAGRIDNITNGKWTDEEIFNEARKWTIATHQKIVVYDWLPRWIMGNDTLENYTAYDPTVNAAISHVFQTSAMRFGHTLVPPGVYRRSKNCTFYTTTKATDPNGADDGIDGTDKLALRTCNTFWNPQEGVNEHDIDGLLMGMASQVAEKEDNIITPDLRDDVFGPLEFSRPHLWQSIFSGHVTMVYQITTLFERVLTCLREKPYGMSIQSSLTVVQKEQRF
jgi:dual oxidase